MRKLKRSVARHNMKKKEIPNINRKKGSNKRSFFAENWRKYVTV